MSTPRPIKRILAGTGLTPESVGGVLLARWLAAKLGASLHVVHVIEMVAQEQEVAIPGLAAAHERHAREELDLFARAHGLGNGDVTLEVVVGSTEAEILRAARRVGADLVVLGRYGRGGPRRGTLGSVADRVVRKCPVSVLVADPVFRGEFKRIGVATDFSAESEVAVRRAMELARLSGVQEVMLLHAYELPRGFHTIMSYEEAQSRMEAVAAERAAAWRASLAGEGVDLILRTTHSSAGRGVPELAELERLDLVVVHTHGRSRPAMFMMERKTEKILGGCTCSVWAEKSPEMYQGMVEALGELLGV